VGSCGLRISSSGCCPGSTAQRASSRAGRSQRSTAPLLPIVHHPSPGFAAFAQASAGTRGALLRQSGSVLRLTASNHPPRAGCLALRSLPLTPTSGLAAAAVLQMDWSGPDPNPTIPLEILQPAVLVEMGLGLTPLGGPVFVVIINPIFFLKNGQCRTITLSHRAPPCPASRPGSAVVLADVS
jgi:hypothetical protein